MNVYSAVTKPYLGHMMLMDTFPFPGNAEVRTFFPPSVLAVRNLSPRILYQLNITGGPFSWLIIIYCHLSHGRSGHLIYASEPNTETMEWWDN